MVIGIIGENCSGKSTLANEIQRTIGAEVITGKDYLRMAKSESEATALFKERMHGNLPAPVEQMLERKHGLFDSEAVDYRFDGVNGDAAALCKLLQDRIAV